MTKIDKIKSMDVHISFCENGVFGYALNGEGIEDGVEIPVEQLRIVARTLSRLAVDMWTVIDNAMLKEEKKLGHD